MSRTKLSYAVLLAFGALAFILAACTGGGGTKGTSPNLELRSDTAIAGLEAFISYDAAKLEYVGVNAAEGVDVAAIVRDGGVKVALVVRNGSASGALATVQFNAKVSGAQAKVASMTKVDAAAVALSNQAIAIADIAVSADMANYQLGDATLDGSVNIFDAVAVNANANGAQATPTQKVLSDMDGNYAINNLDVSAALNKVVNAGTNGLDASLVVKPQRLNLASGASGTVVVFNGGTAALNVSGASFSGASANARVEGVSGQSYAFDVSATASGPVVVDAGTAGQQTFFVTVNGSGSGGQGGHQTLGYMDGDTFVEIAPEDVGTVYPLENFIFKTWLENEANVCDPHVAAGEICDENHANYVIGISPNGGGGGTGLNRSRPSADEKEESAPSYTQNVAGAYVFLRRNGNLYPVTGAEVRWFIDDAACWQVRDYSNGRVNQQYQAGGPEVEWVYDCDAAATSGSATYVREGSMFIGGADDEEVNGSGVNSAVYAETYTNRVSAPNINTLYPSDSENVRFPRWNQTGVDDPNRNGFTWITLYSPDHMARARVNVVAYVGGHEIDKDWLTKEFSLPDCPVNVVVRKNVDTDLTGGFGANGLQTTTTPGVPATFRITLTGSLAADAPSPCNVVPYNVSRLIDRAKTDQITPRHNEDPRLDNIVDVYRLLANSFSLNDNRAVLPGAVTGTIAVNNPADLEDQGAEAQGVANDFEVDENSAVPFGSNPDYEGFDASLANLRIGDGGVVTITFQAVADREDTYCNSVSIDPTMTSAILSGDQISENDLTDRVCFDVIGPRLEINKYPVTASGAAITSDTALALRNDPTGFRIVVTNVGAAPVSGPFTITDRLATVNGAAVPAAGNVNYMVDNISVVPSATCVAPVINPGPVADDGFDVICGAGSVLPIGGTIEINFDAASSTFGTYCDVAAMAAIPNVEINDGTDYLDDDACLSIYNLEIEKTQYNQGVLMGPNDTIQPGQSYRSRIVVTNRSGAPVSNVRISDLIGQLQNAGQPDTQFIVEYDESTCAVGLANEAAGNETNADTHSLVVCPELYTIPDGGNIVMTVVSTVPADYPSGRYCNTAKWEILPGGSTVGSSVTPLAQDTDEACIRVEREFVSVFDDMIDIAGAVDDNFPRGTSFQLRTWIGNECSSTENLINHNFSFAIPAEFTVGSYSVTRYERVGAATAVAFDSNTGTPVVGTFSSSTAITPTGTAAAFTTVAPLEPCEAFLVIHNVSSATPGDYTTTLSYSGVGSDSGNTIMAEPAETSTVN